MKLTILGGSGVWPGARQACGGYLLEDDDTTVLIDPGFGVLPQLLARRDVADIDAVLVSHGHLDHCADLTALLRARVLGGRSCPPVPVFAPRASLARLLAAEGLGSVRRGADVIVVGDGERVRLGPLVIDFALLPHHVPNLGMRIAAGDELLAYTGDSGECRERVTLAKDADLLLAEATYADEVPPGERGHLSSAGQIARLAREADVRGTILTHLWPGESAERALAAARRQGLTSARVAFAGLTVDLGRTGAPPSSRAQAWRRELEAGPPAWTASAGSEVALRGRRASGAGSAPCDVPVLPRRAAIR